MKRAHKKLSIICLNSMLAFISIIAIGRYMQDQCTIQKVTCTIDSRIASVYAKELEHSITAHNKHDVQKTITNLYTLYPWIQSVDVHYNSPCSINLSIHAQDPYIKLNNTYLTYNGTVIPCDIYEPHLYTDIYTMQMAATIDYNKSLPSDLYAYIKSIPDTIFDQFTITWYNQNYLILSDKQKPYYTLLATVNNSFDTLLHITNTTDLLLKNCRNKKTNQPIIDCRFAEQIIVYDDAIRGNHAKGSG
jgi:hypothetical protein